MQGKRAEAVAEYVKAYKAFPDNVEYRRLVEIKLNALGERPQVVAVAAVPGRGQTPAAKLRRGGCGLKHAGTFIS